MDRVPRRLRQLFGLFTAAVMIAGPATALAENISVGGVGMAMPLIQRLAEVYHKRNPGTTVNVTLPPLGSGGGLRALAAGRIDLALSGRGLTAEEESQVGKAVLLARTPLGLATSDGTRQAGLSTRDVAAVYAGQLATWDNGRPIRLIMRAERESDTLYLRQLAPEVDKAMAVAFGRKGLVVAENDLDTIKLITTVQGSLGPVTTGLAALQGNRVKFLPIDGVAPSARALAEGRYPLYKTLYLVTPVRPTIATQRFAAFLQSPAAKKIMAAADFLPSSE